MSASLPPAPYPWVEPVWKAVLAGLLRLVELVRNFCCDPGAAGPESLALLETEVRNLAVRLICDPLVASGIRFALSAEPAQEAAADLVSKRPYARLQKKDEKVRIRMLGGSLEELTTAYYLIRPPKGPGRQSTTRGPAGNGFYPALELLGIHGRVTPAVSSLVAAQLARSPIDEATSLLKSQGLELNSKTVARLGRDFSKRALDFEQHLIDRMNSGEKGSVAKGLRLGIGTDGGRVRTRKPYGRRRRSTRRKRFKGEWREPKVLVIYEMDDQGKRKKGGLHFYAGTMAGADGFFELLAAYLCFIGAHLAAEIVILGDGAEWIWNRIDMLLARTGIKRSAVTEVVDFYHAVERLNEIAARKDDWPDWKRQIWVKSQVTRLKAGHLSAMQSACDEIDAELSRYFRNNASRLNYPRCRRKGLPIGSGAVESGIRRVINLRLKGNGIFWGINNAAALICLRCQLLAGRWTKFFSSVSRPKEYWSECAA